MPSFPLAFGGSAGKRNVCSRVFKPLRVRLFNFFELSLVSLILLIKEEDYLQNQPLLCKQMLAATQWLLQIIQAAKIQSAWLLLKKTSTYRTSLRSASRF